MCLITQLELTYYSTRRSGLHVRPEPDCIVAVKREDEHQRQQITLVVANDLVDGA